jgi:ParB family chromosome partitioning protein
MTSEATSSGKRRALGRGLAALIPDAMPPAPLAMVEDGTRRAGASDYFVAPIEDIYPSPDQPRTRFDEAELAELAMSIATHGLIQPLVVRARQDGGYWLIAGERRWRAAQRAGVREAPVVVQRVSSRDAFERALVENVQRADLNPMEEAEAFRRLVSEEFGYTQEQVAARVGKDRATVANALRLLKLPRAVRAMVEERALTMGHARALLALDGPGEIERAARLVVARGLSVRATEALVKREKSAAEERPAAAPGKSASVRDLENRLARALGAPVAVQEARRGQGGRIEIRYADLDDLDRLLARLFG